MSEMDIDVPRRKEERRRIVERKDFEGPIFVFFSKAAPSSRCHSSSVLELYQKSVSTAQPTCSPPPWLSFQN